MEERKLVAMFGIAVIALMVMNAGVSPGDAINVTDDATILISINTKTMIDITPDNMSFGTLDPGSRSINYTNEGMGAGMSKTGFQIENIGSTNITNIWLNVTQPSERPFGTGDSTKYNAGNFMAVSINVSPDGNGIGHNSMSFVDRLEYNETRHLIYLNLPLDTKSYGRLRSGHNEYFWALYGDTTQCNASSDGSGLNFRIGLSAHNQTQTGTIDLVGGAEDVNWDTINLAAMYEGGTNANWSYSTMSPNYITVDGPSSVYCVAAYLDCSKVRIFRWNADAPGAESCGLSGKGYAYNSTNSELFPGDSMAMNVEIRVPLGTPAGSIGTGYLTVIGQSSG